MELIEQPVQKDLFTTGLDSFGQSPLVFSGSEVNAKASTMYESGVPSNFIQTGDLIQRLNLVDGWLQSDNFVTGVSGWRIDSDGNVEFQSGDFRGDISAASGTFSGTLYVGDSKIEIDGAGDSYGFKVKDSSGNVIIFLGIE